MKTIQEWFDAYGESHQNKTNKLIHWICVPTIFFSIVGLLSTLPAPFLTKLVPTDITGFAHFGTVLILLGMLFYIRLSWKISIGMLIFSLAILWILKWLHTFSFSVGAISIVLFVVAWIGQFWGHKIEGKKPSFFQDLQFLMIGPIWLLGFIYKKLNIKP